MMASTSKAIVTFNGMQLQTMVSVELEYSLINFAIRRYVVECVGLTPEFLAIRDALKSTDTNIVSIDLVNTNNIPNVTIPFLRSYAGWHDLSYRETPDEGFRYQLSGWDIFAGLNVSDIVQSAFPPMPIYIQDLLGNILQELQYPSVYQYQPSSGQFLNGDKYQTFTLLKNANGTAISKPLSPPIISNATKGSDFIAVDPLLKGSPDLFFAKNSNLPRPDGHIKMKASEFIGSLLQLRNLYLLSNGVDTLTITRPKIQGTSIGTISTNPFITGNNASTIIGAERGDLGTELHMKGLPSYYTVCIAQGNAKAGGGTPFVVGRCVDTNAVPHYQYIHPMKNISASKADMDYFATVVANARRSMKYSYNYTVAGSFFTQSGELYAPNQLVYVDDYIGDYQSQMLITTTTFRYTVEDGSTTMLTVSPAGSFSYIEPEQLLKIFQTRKKPSKKSQPKH